MKSQLLASKITKKTSTSTPKSAKSYNDNKLHANSKMFQQIRDYSVSTFKIVASDIRDIHVNTKKYEIRSSSQKYTEIVVALKTKDCPIAKREHNSNHQVIIIDTVHGARMKCHDNLCKGSALNVNAIFLPKNISEFLGPATTTTTQLEEHSETETEAEPEAIKVEIETHPLIFPIEIEEVKAIDLATEVKAIESVKKVKAIDSASDANVIQTPSEVNVIDSASEAELMVQVNAIRSASNANAIQTPSEVNTIRRIKVGRNPPLQPEKENVIRSIMESKCEDDPDQPDLCKMDYTIKSIPPISPNGSYESYLEHNRYCPIHKKDHDEPQNYIRLDSQGQKYILCRLEPGSFYPDPVAQIPQNQLSIIYQDNRVVNNYYTTTANESIANQTILPSEFEDDGLVMFIDNAELRNVFLRALDGNHHSIANLYYHLNKKKFRCLGRNGTWFQFEGHIWVVIKADLIRAQLSESEFLRPFEEALIVYRQNPALRGADKKAKKIDILLQQLLTDSFLNHVVHQCETIFYKNHTKFEEELNNANITPYNNGVIDLNTLDFRAGRPEDCMTLSTKIDYTPFNLNNSIVKEILNWFEEAQPNAEQRLYLQKLISTFLTKDTHWQQIWVFTGSGQNGKSFFIERILRPALGDFFGTAATQLLTRKRENANETNEALMNILKKRVAIFSEPAQNEILQADILKNITGEDHITARGNYQSQQDVSPDFKAVVVCNNIPKVSEDSYAVWRRIRVVDWPMTFKNNPNPDNPLEKQLNSELSEKVKVWPSYFAGCMVHWLKLLRQDPAFEPPSAVNRHTNQYKEDNDEWKEYRDQYILKTDEKDNYIQWADLREHFRKWHDAQFPREKMTKRGDEVKKYFINKLGQWASTTTAGNVQLRGWWGFQFK